MYISYLLEDHEKLSWLAIKIQNNFHNFLLICEPIEKEISLIHNVAASFKN